MTLFRSDIDIDLGDRQQILDKIKYIGASIDRNGELIPHNTGIYITDIPGDLNQNIATIDYKTAEERGYIKLDLLNVGVYTQIHNEEELEVLMNTEPPWHRLNERDYFEKIIHIGNHYSTYTQIKGGITNIEQMAMFLALIRPAKRHLIGRSWDEIAKEIWIRPSTDDYYFKKSHGTAYAHLVVVHMNLTDLAD